MPTQPLPAEQHQQPPPPGRRSEPFYLTLSYVSPCLKAFINFITCSRTEPVTDRSALFRQLIKNSRVFQRRSVLRHGIALGNAKAGRALAGAARDTGVKGSQAERLCDVGEQRLCNARGLRGALAPAHVACISCPRRYHYNRHRRDRRRTRAPTRRRQRLLEGNMRQMKRIAVSDDVLARLGLLHLHALLPSRICVIFVCPHPPSSHAPGPVLAPRRRPASFPAERWPSRRTVPGAPTRPAALRRRRQTTLRTASRPRTRRGL